MSRWRLSGVLGSAMILFGVFAPRLNDKSAFFKSAEVSWTLQLLFCWIVVSPLGFILMLSEL